MTTESENAYVAAFIDGEGHVSIRSARKGFVPLIEVTNTNLEVIEWIAERFGGVIRSTRSSTSGKTAYVLTWHNKENLTSLLNRVEPYAIVKREQMYYLRQFLETIVAPGVHVSQEVRDFREELRMNCTSLHITEG